MIRGIFFKKYIEIGPLAEEEIAFHFFFIFSSGGHLDQRSGTVLAILVKG